MSNQGCRNRFYTEDITVHTEKYSMFGIDVHNYRNERAGLS